MKKIFLFILLPVLFQINLNAEQIYKRCLDEGMVRWSIIDYYITDFGPISTELVAYGDTLIHGLLYKRMYLDYSFNYLEVEESNANWKNHRPDINRFHQWENLFIRESEDASRLYIYDSLEEEEYLISDLNLEEGDEYQVSYPGYSFVATVESVYMKEGLKHIQLIYHYSETLTFIEGVGPDVWFIYKGYDEYSWNIYANGFVNCFQNQSVFYKYDSEFAFCPCGSWFLTALPIIPNKNYTIQIQENNIEMTFFLPDSRQIAVYDVSGRLYYQREFSKENRVDIPRSSFPKGVYLLKIFNKDNSQAEVCKIIL